MFATLVLAWLAVAQPPSASESGLVRPLPESRSYQSVVTGLPCQPTVTDEVPWLVAGVVASDAEPEPQSQPVPSLYELFSGCPRAGMFIFRLTVTQTGTVKKPHIVRGSGCAAADQRALQAVRAWRYLPARRNGRAVSARISVSLNVGG
jgi:TonB family protein